MVEIQPGENVIFILACCVVIDKCSTKNWAKTCFLQTFKTRLISLHLHNFTFLFINWFTYDKIPLYKSSNWFSFKGLCKERIAAFQPKPKSGTTKYSLFILSTSKSQPSIKLKWNSIKFILNFIQQHQQNNTTNKQCVQKYNKQMNECVSYNSRGEKVWMSGKGQKQYDNLIGGKFTTNKTTMCGQCEWVGGAQNALTILTDHRASFNNPQGISGRVPLVSLFVSCPAGACVLASSVEPVARIRWWRRPLLWPGPPESVVPRRVLHRWRHGEWTGTENWTKINHQKLLDWEWHLNVVLHCHGSLMAQVPHEVWYDHHFVLLHNAPDCDLDGCVRAGASC